MPLIVGMGVEMRPPGREDFWILKITPGPFPESAARFDFGRGAAPDLWVT